jgi:DNA primase
MSSRAVEQIKERLPITDIISSYIKLDRAGANFKGRCPFHQEKTPSFVVSPERGSYYCFGCGAKGDVFTFVQEFEKLSFKEALILLADRAGIVLDDYQNKSHDAAHDAEADEKDRLRKIMETATSFFEGEMKTDDKALEYLHTRGLEDKTIKEWRLGSTKKGWSNLYEFLKSQGHSDADIEKAGLIKKSMNENAGQSRYYDRFRSRIMFPISDPSGKVIAFTGRFKDWEKDEAKEGKEEIVPAKYLNSPDTPLFDKSRTLYGFHKAKQNISKWKYTLLVEGQMDLLMAHQSGFNNAVATSGTALTRQQLEMLIRFSKNMLIAYDGDKAGVEAARRAWTLALSLGMDVKMAIMPPGTDPADIILKDASLFKEVLRKGSHIIEFYLNALMLRGIEGRNLGKAVETEILPYLKAIESPIDQAHFISLIASRTGIKEDALLASLNKLPLTGAVVPTGTLPSSESSDTIASKQIFPKKRLIAGLYLLLKDEEKARSYLTDTEQFDELKDELMFSAEEWMSRSSQKAEQYVQDLVASLEKETLQKDLEETMRQKDEADRSGNTERSTELLKKSNDIIRKLAHYS